MGPAVGNLDTFHPVIKASLAPFGHLRREKILRRHRNLDLPTVALPHFHVRARLICRSALRLDGQHKMKVDVPVAKSGSVHLSRGGDFLFLFEQLGRSG